MKYTYFVVGVFNRTDYMSSGISQATVFRDKPITNEKDILEIADMLKNINSFKEYTIINYKLMNVDDYSEMAGEK